MYVLKHINKVLDITGVFTENKETIPLLFPDFDDANSYRKSNRGIPEFDILSNSKVRTYHECKGHEWARQPVSQLMEQQPAAYPEPQPVPVPVIARAWFVSFIYFENDSLTTAGNSLVHTNIERITGPDDIRNLAEVVKMYNQFPPEMSLALLNYKREPAADREVKNPDQVEEVPAPAAKGLRLV